MAWTASCRFDGDVSDVSGVTADNQSMTTIGGSSAQNSGNFNS